MDEDLFAKLEHGRQISPSAQPKIQRVEHYLRNRKDFAHYYSPKILSLGPIHHGEPHLELGEQYKLTWASTYVNGDRNRARNLHGKIVAEIKELKNLYNEFNDQQLARMWFLDGCALLQILKNSASLNAKVDLLALAHEDALLLENQLPFRLLNNMGSLTQKMAAD